MKISIETIINAPLELVWQSFVTPEDIVCWNFAIDEWCCPKAELELVVGGSFNYRMEAKDGSFGFDFSGTFVAIKSYQALSYTLGDGRRVDIEFINTPDGVKVTESFDAEDENSAEMQRQGWLGILHNFRRHVESQSG